MFTEPTVPQDLFSLEMRMDAPVFQRPYVWGQEEQWAPLWEDLRALAESGLAHRATGADDGHFLGAIVLQERQTGFSEMSSMTIIDGQQRLTTLQLLLHALAGVLRDHGLEDLARRAERLTRNEVAPGHSRPEDAFKVWPTNKDRDAYRAVLDAASADAVPAWARASRFARADLYFRTVINDWLLSSPQDAMSSGQEETSPELAARATAVTGAAARGLRIVSIRLSPWEDAQSIFETLNARGTPLTAMDLVKNFLLQSLDPHSPSTQSIYERHWGHFETEFWQQRSGFGETQQPRSVAFLNWWLTARTGAVVPARTTFAAFKRYTHSQGRGQMAVLADLSAAALRYQRLNEASSAPHGELDALGMLHYRAEALGLDVLKPLMVWLLEPSQQDVPGEQRRRLIAAVESWVVRRSLLRKPSTGLNRFVVEQLMRAVAADPARMGERCEALLAAQTSPVSYWPDDEEIREALLHEPVYRSLIRGRVRMILEAVEDHHRGYPDGHRRSEEPIVRGACTVEHLMPQQWRTNWADSADDGAEEDAAARRDRLLHTLGNLTLVTQRLNSSLSNSSWESKRKALEATTSLLITRAVTTGHPQEWGDDDIRRRTADMIEDILSIWVAPVRPSGWAVEAPASRSRAGAIGDEWNGRDWYVAFGETGGSRRWADAMRFGFVSGGGGAWYSRTLRRLPVGARVFVCVPGRGYVGVGTVEGEARRFDEAVVDCDGAGRLLQDLPLEGGYCHEGDESDDLAEWVVPVRWEHAVALSEAVWRPGMFANQNTATRLRHQVTVETVLHAFGLG
ncbi:DUF262 domain-containing protein [Actinomyces bowdenii]|uniref:GmrSD restriction endonuclease domain-containing protein n=1 Tax=Actinomyces bowdenii TaxID=131109 RepID=UPI001ABC83B0|nr:DUF262 domain-containing protein [Actinomyces bowdenii]